MWFWVDENDGLGCSVSFLGSSSSFVWFEDRGASGEGRDRGSGWGLPYERLRKVQGWRVIEEEENGGVEGGERR